MSSLRDIRRQTKLSQNALAKRLCINQNTYSQYEIGKRQPNLQMLKQLKQVLGCSYDELIEALLSAMESKNKMGE